MSNLASKEAKSSNNIPSYLQELIEDKPSSLLKLVAAWDDLAIETQIQILYSYKNRHINSKSFNQLKAKALNSKNDYVRYLIAELANFDEKNPDDKKLLSLISNDSSQLVRHTHDESNFIEYFRYFDSELKKDTFEKFFSLPSENQIMLVSKWEKWEAKKFLALIEWAISNGKIEQSIIENLVEEYSKNLAALKLEDEMPYDGYMSCYFGEALDNLWSLIPKLGDTYSACLLAKNLPTGIYRNVISEEVIKPIHGKALKYLLYRDDFYDTNFRKQILFSKNYDDDVREAAALTNLDLTNEEFFDIIKNEEKSILKILIRCNQTHPCLPPVYVYALKDARKAISDYSLGDIKIEIDAKTFEQFFNVSLKWCESELEKVEAIKRRLLELAIYEIARDIANLQDEDIKRIPEILGDELKFLEKSIIRSDAWKTYMNFSNILWQWDGYQHEKRLLREVDSSFSKFYPIPPKSSEDLFGPEGSEVHFVGKKLSYFYNEMLKMSKAIDIVNNELKEFKQYSMFFYIAIFLMICVVAHHA